MSANVSPPAADPRAEVIADIEAGAEMILVASLKDDPRFAGPKGVPHIATVYRLATRMGAVRGPRGQLVVTEAAILRHLRRINSLPPVNSTRTDKQREQSRRRAREVLASAGISHGNF